MTSDPDQIRDSIERTQQNLSADIDALTEKVSPPRIVERRVQRTRMAMTSLKDKVMGDTTETTSNLAETAGSSAGTAKSALADTAASAKDALAGKASSTADAASATLGQARQRARGNPLAVGLIAFGAGWLLSSLLPATGPEQQAAAQVKDLTVEKGRPVVQQAGQEAAQQLRESAEPRVQAIRETASAAAATVAGEARSQASDVADHAQEARDRVTRQASPDGS